MLRNEIPGSIRRAWRHDESRHKKMSLPEVVVPFNSKRSSDRPDGATRTGRILEVTEPLVLESGAILNEYQIGFQTYGVLNAEKSNAILVCHALTGDQYIADTHPITGKPSWWA